MSRFLALVALASVSTAACGGAGSAPFATADPITGQYIGAGGGAALANTKALADGFKRLHAGVDWQFENVGSTAAVKLVQEGSVDLGFMSRELRPDERAGLESVPIGSWGRPPR